MCITTVLKSCQAQYAQRGLFRLLAAVLIFCCAYDAGAEIRHVGTNWSGTHYATIQTGIDNATDGDEIWVEQGTYALTAMITVSKKVSMYGGFTGSETSRAERNWTTHVTTVDGQNTVGCFYTTADATIDGFTITKGYKKIRAEMMKKAQAF